jgi:hypothetical protein
MKEYIRIRNIYLEYEFRVRRVLFSILLIACACVMRCGD